MVGSERERQTDSLTYVTETGTHDYGFVAVLFVVVEDLFDRFHTRVLVAFIVLSGCLLVPIEDLYAEGMNWKEVRHMLERIEKKSQLTRPTKGEMSVTPASAQATA